MTWIGLGSSEVRRQSCGESEEVVKVQTYFSEATDMADGRISGVYRDILSRRGLSSMVMVGRFKSGIPQSIGK